MEIQLLTLYRRTYLYFEQSRFQIIMSFGSDMRRRARHWKILVLVHDPAGLLV